MGYGSLCPAYATAAALGDRGLSHIILVTDAPHTEPAPHGVALQKRSLLAIRDYLGLVSYGALGRFQRPPASELRRVAQAAAADVPRDRCFRTADQIRQSLPES